MRGIKFRYTCDRGNGHIFSEDFTLNEIERGEASHWIAKNLVAEGQLHRRQYIEQKDKNRVEIYEGDIVKRLNINLTVYWHEFTACWRMTGRTGVTKGDMALMCEVIGNIYENPELKEDR